MQIDMANNGARDVQWLGFKLMLSQLDSIKVGLGDSNVVVLFHWRRNVLRQIISNSANHLDKVLAPAGQHESHPTTAEEAAVIANKTMPYIPSENLDSEISDHFQQRCRIMQMVRELGVRTCPVSHMEDWAATNHRRKATWLIESCLGVKSRSLTAPQKPIHYGTPVLETVKNPTEVEHALQDSTFEYMLEQYSSEEEVYHNLRLSDAYEHSECSSENSRDSHRV